MKSQVLSLWLFGLTQAQGRSHAHAHAHVHARSHDGQHHLVREAEELGPSEPLAVASEPEAETAHYNHLFVREYDELTGVPEDIIPPSSTVSVSVTVAPTGTAIILPSLSDVEPHTEGVVLTSLNATGRPTEARLLTSTIPDPTSLLPLFLDTSTSISTSTPTSKPTSKATTSSFKGKAVPISSPPKSQATSSSAPAATSSTKSQPQSGSRLFKMADIDIFNLVIDTKAPPSTIKTRTDHPVPRLGLTKNGPIQTNKFYSNFFLGDQQSPTFTFPYSIAWAAGSGASTSWGMSCSHIEARQRVFGDKKFNNAAAYFINPIGIQSMVISAKELGKSTVVTTDSMTQFSARINLAKDKNSAPAISFPVVQGMAYVTAQYNGAVPIIQSGVYFKTMTRVTKDPKTNVAKYNFVLEDGTTWRVYAYKTKGDQLDLKVVNNGLAQSTKPFYGTIQVAKDPKTTGSEALLDDGAGIYPTNVALTGALPAGNTAYYTLSFSRAGHQTGNLYMYALPHHVDSFDADTKGRVKAVKLQTTTKGIATMVSGNKWTMVEGIQRGLYFGLFAPWDASKGAMKTLSQAAKNKILPIAQKEISQNIDAQTNLDSMYFSGKALAKFGTLLYTINDLLGSKALAQAGLPKLKAAFATFASNKQKYPLVYESAWGGVVSSASYATGNSGADFGNTYYNDHHFHYGYHILAAAYIAYLDPNWIAANKDYVNTLCREISNPSAQDKYFPQNRNFDWYHGHSWAHGLFAAWDGKDQESSSEDMMATYALLAWGRVSGNVGIVNRALLQLAVQQRSMQSYYLYTNNNVNQPKEFIGNKVAGILFENKIDHTTYFSPDIEAIQGIHMIPLLPPSTQIRTKQFVLEEWNAFFSSGRIDKINNAWKSIIWGNYATVSPKDAWAYFSKANFDASLIDGGASLTWYMAYSAAMGSL